MNHTDGRDPLLDELDDARRRIWDACGRDIDKHFTNARRAPRPVGARGLEGGASAQHKGPVSCIALFPVMDDPKPRPASSGPGLRP